MNLHEWTTERVERAEVVAQRAADCTGASRWEPTGSLIVTVPEEGTGGDVVIEAAFHTYDDALVHAALYDPTAVLRRCEADRRVLGRHRLPEPDEWLYPGCAGCDTTGEFDDPVTDNINDCPELLDLAHAHGITEADLAALDRPQRPEPTPGQQRRLRERARLTVPITTSDVPQALRGHRWKP